MKKVIASSVLASSVLLPINLLVIDSASIAVASTSTIVLEEQSIGEKAVLNAPNVNVRSGAGTDFENISTVHTGQIVSILTSEKNNIGEVWYKVSYDSTEGWIKSDYLKATETDTIQSKSTISGQSYVGTTQKIGKNASNMRSGATTSYKLIDTIPAGTSLKILGTFTNANKEVWFNVEYKGKKGWVLADLFVLSAVGGETATSMKVVNQTTIHKGATKSYAVVATAKPGTTLVVHQEFTNASKEKWVQVTYASGKKGWMLASAFEDSSIANKVVIKTSTVHSGATKDYKTVATVKMGTKLAIHQEFTNALKEKWYQVTYATGKKGWMPASAFESVSTSPGDPSPEIPGTDEGIIEEQTNLIISVPVANMRSGPGTSYDVVTQAKLNETFVSSHYTTDTNSEKWYKVSTTSGDAWLHQSVVSVGIDENPGVGETVTIERANALMYADSNYNSAVLQGIPKNTTFTVLNKHIAADGTIWININAQNKIGWIPDFEVNKDIPTKFGKKTSTVYSGASATAKKVDTIYLNSPVKILRTLNSWVNIETQNEKRGWIQASELSDTSTVSPISLTNGKAEVRNGQQYLVWSKPSKFKLTYSMPSSNVLKVYGNLSQINEIKTKVTGVASMRVEQVSGGTSVLYITFNSNYTYTIRDSDKELTIKVVPKGLAGKKIIIDAGHGAKDPGAIGPKKTKEKDVVLATAIALKKELEANGAQVILTRSTDVFLELKERTDISNRSDYDAFISLHADAFSSTSKGSTTYYNSSVNFNGPKSLALAKSVQSDLVKSVGTYNRGVKEQVFYVNRMNELPSVLVELAFISNPTEEAQLASSAFQKNAAIGIRKGLNNYFNQ